jgi:hypothetical protein
MCIYNDAASCVLHSCVTTHVTSYCALSVHSSHCVPGHVAFKINI